jgi:hypothetical protein
MKWQSNACLQGICPQQSPCDIEPMPESIDMWEQSHPPLTPQPSPASQQTDWPRNQKRERGSMTEVADKMVTKMLVCEEKLSIKSRQMATTQPTM